MKFLFYAKPIDCWQLLFLNTNLSSSLKWGNGQNKVITQVRTRFFFQWKLMFLNRMSAVYQYISIFSRKNFFFKKIIYSIPCSQIWLFTQICTHIDLVSKTSIMLLRTIDNYISIGIPYDIRLCSSIRFEYTTVYFECIFTRIILSLNCSPNKWDRVWLIC